MVIGGLRGRTDPIVRDGCIVLPPRPCRAISSVKGRVERRNLSRAILGACHPSGPARRRSPAAPRIVVVGDLMLDVVLRVRARARGRHRRARVGCRSCRVARRRTTARWLSRLGARPRSWLRSGGTRPDARSSRRCARDEVPRPRRPRRGRPDRTDRRRRRAGRGAVVRGRPCRRRPAPSRRPRAGLVRRDRRPPRAGLLAARRAARARPAVARSSSARGRGRPRQHRSRVDRAAPRPWPAGRAALVARRAPDLLFATAAEAEALLGRLRRRGSARARAGRRRSSAGAKGATVLARDGDGSAAALRGRDHAAVDGGRHDRGRRRLRRRVPRRLARRAAAGRPLRADALQRGRRRPPCRGAPAVQPAHGARRSVTPRARGRYAAPMASTDRRATRYGSGGR